MEFCTKFIALLDTYLGRVWRKAAFVAAAATLALTPKLWQALQERHANTGVDAGSALLAPVFVLATLLCFVTLACVVYVGMDIVGRALLRHAYALHIGAVVMTALLGTGSGFLAVATVTGAPTL